MLQYSMLISSAHCYFVATVFDTIIQSRFENIFIKLVAPLQKMTNLRIYEYHTVSITVFPLFCDYWRNMGPLVHNRDQKTVETVKSWLKLFFRQERTSIWRLTKCDLHRLPGECQNGYKAILYRIIGTNRNDLSDKEPILYIYTFRFLQAMYVCMIDWTH